MRWIVKTTVKGATRINKREFDNEASAAEWAKRWRSSNSTGDYVAYITPVSEEGEIGYVPVPNPEEDGGW
jgi:hypothetical protein